MVEQIICHNASIGYEGKIVVEGLDFNVNKSDYLCIIGENGAGKSTLMKTLLQLKKTLQGEVLLGKGLSNTDIGYLPQQTVIQKDFPATVEEIVISGCLNKRGLRPFYNKEEKNKAIDNMKKLGIYNLSKYCYRELSGGQKQRVLLARALCATEKIIFLDEPVAGLDPSASIEMYRLIEKINKEYGVTIVMISHDLEQAFRYATHILHIRDGQQIYFGSREEHDIYMSDLSNGRKFI